jgi:hypothetical protein
MEEVPKPQGGRPSLIDLMENEQVSPVVNTPTGRGARTDQGEIRAAAVAAGGDVHDEAAGGGGGVQRDPRARLDGLLAAGALRRGNSAFGGTWAGRAGGAGPAWPGP